MPSPPRLSAVTLDPLAFRRQPSFVVFEFIRRRLQGGADKSAKPIDGPTRVYEEKRQLAQSLHELGRTDEAVVILENLAATLAGADEIPLAVAVRHQIHQWRPERNEQETPAEDGRRMAAQRAESGRMPVVASGPVEPRIQQLARQTPFFMELSADEIGGLIASTGLVTHPQGSLVVEEGHPGDQLYIVTRGVLGVKTEGAEGREVRVGSLTVGDFFGEVSLLTGRPRSATVVSETDAECLQIDRRNWEALAAAHPRLKKLLEDALAERAQLSADAVVDDFRRSRGEGPEGEA